jgi:hypothetical protein
VLVKTPLSETDVTPVKVTAPPLVETVPPLFAVLVGVIRFNPEVGTEGAAHFKPVLSELSATILQEQSQRIVPLA